MPIVTEIEDLRRMHKRRAPKMFYDYAESGSWTEQTFRENSSDFDLLRLRQRVAVNMEDRSTRSTMIGREVAMPMALAPVGLTGMQHADGEILAAQAAEAFGVPFTLSTMSICSIEDVAEHTTAPFWFQLYVMRDKDYVSATLERAKAAGCDALVLTLDLQILGQRHKDLKNGLTAPPALTPATILDLSRRWGMGDGHAAHQAPLLRQHRRARQGRRGRAQPLDLDRRAVRPQARLGEGRRAEGGVGRQADPQGHPRRRGRPARGGRGLRRDRGVQPWRAPARRRDLLDPAHCPPSCARWATRWRCTSIRGSAPGRTS